MKLAISNIAWTNEEEADVAAKLQELGVRYIGVIQLRLLLNRSMSISNGGRSTILRL